MLRLLYFVGKPPPWPKGLGMIGCGTHIILGNLLLKAAGYGLYPHLKIACVATLHLVCTARETGAQLRTS